MTIREFFKNKEKLAIHCNTEEKAKALWRAFNIAGYRWCTGERYNDYTSYVWTIYGEETCYSNIGTYGEKEWYESNGLKILEFEDIEIVPYLK